MDSNIITSILEIDQRAKDKISEAEKQKNKIIADAKAEEERMISDKVREADEELKKLEAEEQRKAEERLVAVETEKATEISRLNDVYNKCHTAWEDKIFNAIITG